MPLTGAWCWFHSPKAFTKDGVTCVGSVSPNGQQQIHFLDIHSKEKSTITLPAPRIEVDDHNVPAVKYLSDGRVLAAYAGHLSDNFFNIATIDWKTRNLLADAALQFEFPTSFTYANIALLEDQLLIFTRGFDRNPNYFSTNLSNTSLGTVHPFISHDVSLLGENWRGLDGGRPYILFFQDQAEIHFVVSEDHPRAHNNSLYHGVIREGLVFDSFGNEISPLTEFANHNPFDTLSKIWQSGENTTAWPGDICVDRKGRLTIAFSFQVDHSYSPDGVQRPGADLRYAVARKEGNSWQTREIAYAGRSLYPEEPDYSGGIAIDRHDSDFLAISANVMPHNGEPISVRRKFQIFLVALSCEGSPRFSQLTHTGEADNIRPIFSEPLDDKGHSLLWMQGRYSTFTDFDTKIKSLDFVPGENCYSGSDFHADLAWKLGTSSEMPVEENEFLIGQFSTMTEYLEYGTGSSTISAIKSGVKKITSVETDGVWAASLRKLAQPLLISDQEFVVLSSNMGPTGEWGTPIDKELLAGDEYASAPWLLGEVDPTFVLIDGRFRVRTLFEVILRSQRPCTIMFDDYYERDHYWICNDYFDVQLRVGRAAIFFTKRVIALPTEEILEKYAKDPR